jgi:hypothetical protein
VVSLNIYSWDNNIWPSEILCPFVSEYIAERNNLTANELQNEYYYILDFLEKAIEASKENIGEIYYQNNFIKKYPIFVNGELKIIGERSMRKIWDIEKYDFFEEFDIFEGAELIHLHNCMQTFNQFVEHWFKRTGQTIRQYYDIEKEINSSLLILQQAGYFIYDCNVDIQQKDAKQEQGEEEL